MTKQEIFDKVWNYFIVDRNAFGWDALNGRCVYKGEDGQKCAVGCLIPDEMYDNLPDVASYGARVGLLLKSFPGVAEYLGGGNFQILMSIQDAHDSSAPKSDYAAFEVGLRRVASNFYLIVPGDVN